MKKFKAVVLAVASLVISASLAWGASNPATTVTPDQALALLKAGNAQYVKGRVLHLTAQSQPSVRAYAANGQNPYAVILGCIDSRVPPEIIFDRGLNETFSVRVAGNVIADHEIGSIEYAVEHTGVPLVVILGHTKCGAVTSSVGYGYQFVSAKPRVAIPHLEVPNPPSIVETPVGSGFEPTYINSLVNSLIPPMEAAFTAGMSQAAMVDATIVKNVTMVADELWDKSPLIREFVEKGTPGVRPLQKVKIVTGIYDVTTGVVTWIPWAPPVP